MPHEPNNQTLGFPCSKSLPPLLVADDWKWQQIQGQESWIGTDPNGVRWLVKLRDGCFAVRERAFSIIGQALGITCQSSTFLVLPRGSTPLRGEMIYGRTKNQYQLATLHLDSHGPERCSPDCQLISIRTGAIVYSLGELETLGVSNPVDFHRGQMLRQLCGMSGSSDILVTNDHRFVLIDNKHAFFDPSPDLSQPPLQLGNKSALSRREKTIAAELCEDLLALPMSVFEQAVHIPDNYNPGELGNFFEVVKMTTINARIALAIIKN